MKILFICHRFPFPPRRGGKIRPFHIISHLSKTHDVTVASIARSEEEAAAGKGIEEHCSRHVMASVHNRWQIVRAFLRAPTSEPASMGYFYSGYLKKRIRSLLETVAFDLVFVHCSSVAPYVEHVRGVPRILDFGDMDSQKWLDYARNRRDPLKIAYWLEGHKLERRERQLALRFDFCTATTRAELDTLNSFGAPTPTDWFPNGVDFGYFAPADGPYDPNALCFVGRMDYYPNQEAMLDFCRNVLPALRARIPAVKLSIIGAEPSAEIRRLGDLPGVNVTGTVADIRPLVRQSAAAIAPLHIARGTQNKMLECMAMGVPVVCSQLTLRGVDAVDGEHLLGADRPQEYVEALAGLLSDPARRAAFSRAGRERMMERHSWTKSMQRLDSIIERCLGRYERPAAAQEVA